MLWHEFVAEVPFSKISGSIGGIVEQFRQATKTWRQNTIVAGASSLMWPHSGEQRRTRGRADRMGHVSPLENHRLRCQLMKTWRVHALGRVASNQIRAEFIGKKDNKIWFGRRPGKLRARTSVKREC